MIRELELDMPLFLTEDIFYIESEVEE